MPETQLAAPARDENSLAVLIERPEYKNRFGDVMGQRAPQFLSSLLSLSMTTMKDVEPKSIISAAMTAASLDLPINPNLGFAYIIAYKDGNRGGQKFAQFQMGYRGFVQLAMRTRQYRFINACKVFDGELVKYDKLTGELIIAEDKKKSDNVIGYASFFRLTNGFEHSLYMTKEQVDQHAKRYSQAYQKGWKSMWKDDFDAMALKTVLKLNLSKWGVLSVQMEKGLFEDQAVKIDLDAPSHYPDNSEPIPAAQIEDLKSAGATTETPAAAGETTTATPPAAKEKKKATPKKEKLALVTEVPGAGAKPAEGNSQPAAVPAPENNATQLAKKINEAGFMMTDFLVFAVWNKWFDAPEGYFTTAEDGARVPGDPADLEEMVVPEEKAATFIETDNFAMILERLQANRAA